MLTRSAPRPQLWRRWLPLFLLLALSFIPLFWLLGSLPVQQWDEARTGLNGLGIWRYNDWLVLRYQGQPDLWNGKPPLWPWVLALSFKLLGATELALRLPAALAALATVLLVYRAGSQWLKSRLGGLLAGLVLLTTQGYVTLHVARSGDFDALLTLWTTAGALAWLAYLHTGRTRWAWRTGLFFTLAVLTKGIAGSLFGPGLLVATVVLKRSTRLTRWAPWLAAGLVGVAALLWYSIRELAAPGYLAGVWQYEVGGPASAQLEGHFHPYEWYLSLMAETKFTVWLLPALLGWFIGFLMPRQSREGTLSRFTATVAGTFLLIISLVQTKLSWYDAPVYPLLALQAAAGLVWAGRIVLTHLQRRPAFGTQLAAVLAFAAFPYLAQWQFIRHLDDTRFKYSQLLYGRQLREQVRLYPELKEYAIATNGTFNDSPNFYRTAAELTYGHRIRRVAPWQLDSVQVGQTLVACGYKAYHPWQLRYQTQVVCQTDSCMTLLLLSKR